MRHASSKHIFAYWRRLRGDRPAPERRDLNPAALGRYLSDIFLLERDRDGTFRFRVAGTGICALFGKELRGDAALSIASHSSTDDLKDMLSAVTEDGLPVIAGVSALLSDRKSLEAELLLLPLTHNGSSDSRVLGALVLRSHDRLALGDCAGLEILTFRTVNEGDTRFLHPTVPVLAVEMQGAERRGHLTVLNGGQR